MLRPVLVLTLLIGCRARALETTDKSVVADTEGALPLQAALPAPPQPSTSASASALASASVPADCRLRAELEIRRKGAMNLPKLTLFNEGDRPLRLMLPGDGSDYGLPRTPKLTWFFSQNGVPVRERGGASCAYQNDVTPADFFTLEPKGKRVIESWLGYLELEPGRYDMQLRYEHSPVDRVPNGSDVEVAALLQLTDACSVTSNTVSYTIR